MFFDYIHVSFLMMRARPVRAILSLLGIYIGIMALAIILSIREGIRDQIRDLFRTSGVQVVFIYPGFDQATQQIGRLTLDQLRELGETPGVVAALPRLTSEGEAQTSNGMQHLHIVGIDDGFLSVYRAPLLRGRLFIPDEVRVRQPVCVLTEEAAGKLFSKQDPLGADVTIQGVSYQVIGVVSWEAGLAQRTSLTDVDMFIPYPWLSGQASQFIGLAEVRLSPEIKPEQTVRLVKAILSRHDPSRESTYIVRSMAEFAERNEQGADRILSALMAIAGISLLVGGVGVANVMLTNVGERTREVGIRKALGARHRDILLQFLVESSLLSGVGGILSVMTVVGGIHLWQALESTPFPMKPSFGSMTICVFLTLGIGILAGVYPAGRAAGLAPADALRTE